MRAAGVPCCDLIVWHLWDARVGIDHPAQLVMAEPLNSFLRSSTTLGPARAIHVLGVSASLPADGSIALSIVTSLVGSEGGAV
jgi:hypothetical protein